MNLFKITLFFFAIYFLRRFIQFYRVMNEIRSRQEQPQQKQGNEQAEKVVEADFKVLD